MRFQWMEVKGRVDQEQRLEVGNVYDEVQATDVLHERRHIIV